MKIICKRIVVIAVITLFLVVSLEGTASFLLAFFQLKRARIPAERLHTEYDPLLGWVNKRNVFLPDMYGPGAYVRINSQRFRNNEDFDTEIPAGRRRWVFSGDSFTFGYGVSNDQAWCCLLSSLVPDLEAVNMGQGGYGLDQSYLWYMRDGIKFEHNVLVFAFITEDIFRTGMSKFLGYPKPQLSMQDGRIVKPDKPVPRPGFLVRFAGRYEPALSRLSVLRLVNRLGGNAPRKKQIITSKALLDMTLAIFRTLHDDGRQSGRTVLFVHLPAQSSYQPYPEEDALRAALKAHAQANGWVYLDLIEDFRQLAAGAVPALFIQQPLPGFRDSQGHYTEKGNQYIASCIIAEISGNPSIAGIISKREATK